MYKGTKGTNYLIKFWAWEMAPSYCCSTECVLGVECFCSECSCQFWSDWKLTNQSIMNIHIYIYTSGSSFWSPRQKWSVLTCIPVIKILFSCIYQQVIIVLSPSTKIISRQIQKYIYYDISICYLLIKYTMSKIKPFDNNPWLPFDSDILWPLPKKVVRLLR